MTMDIYSHVLPDTKADEMQKLAEMLWKDVRSGCRDNFLILVSGVKVVYNRISEAIFHSLLETGKTPENPDFKPTWNGW